MDKLKLTDNISITDLALFLEKEEILIICDTHLGYEEALNYEGILMPRHQFKDTIIRLNKILDKVNPKTIIINGDIKHEFGKISEQEWRNTIKLIDLLSKHARLVLIKGNHDTILGPIAEKRNITIVENFFINNICITHGDKVPLADEFKKAKTLIIGHEHPAILITDKVRKELFKCFLKGRWNNKTLIVQPSFNLVTEGTDILKENLLSPFLQKSIGDFKVYVVGDKTYFFGKAKDLT